ncbi:hypothetical protein BDV95DRAFT_559758 [Massariosphaeria phaeospora]|uniref:EXPERA domain-containing protein n=1 Tax=Massariosphaeria phaeospora TaxID=100035 RepID=A0A7C8MDC4_9PLEO|nr:hypothetical protein BDV95DRAFT_559758 [Massariosphaeria phaeospora]
MSPSSSTTPNLAVSSSSSKVSPIWSRKKDLVYLVFFLVHGVVMLGFDLTHYYPAAVKPGWMTGVRTWYVATYGDRFFYNPPSFFPLYSLLELLFHLPLTLWLMPALLRNDPRTPLALLVFSLETTVTTMTCLAEMWGWEELSSAQRGWGGLGGMYGAYVVVAVFMGVDAWARLERVVARANGGVEPVAKKEL